MTQPLDLPALLLAAHQAALSAPPAEPPNPAAVDAVLASLPEMAAGARGRGWRFFDLTRHCPADMVAHALDEAVLERLSAAGLASVVGAMHPSGLVISLEGLADAVARLVAPSSSTPDPRAVWLAELSAAWTKRAGEGATVEANGDDITLTAPGVGGERVMMTCMAVARTPEAPGEVVATAARALRLPAWTVAGLMREWERRGVASDAVITSEPGHYRDGRWRAVEVLVFAAGMWRTTLDVEDVRSLSAAEVIERVLVQERKMAATRFVEATGPQPMPLGLGPADVQRPIAPDHRHAPSAPAPKATPSKGRRGGGGGQSGAEAL